MQQDAGVVHQFDQNTNVLEMASILQSVASRDRDAAISLAVGERALREDTAHLSDYKMPSESKPLLTIQTEKPNHYS